MGTWIITGLLALLVVRIVYLEILCGRRSKAFLKKASTEINELHQSAVTTYRAKFGRDPTAPFILLDDEKLTSKKP